MTDDKCPFVEFMQEQQYCGKHQFLHGGEANHLREEIEELLNNLGYDQSGGLCACGEAAVREKLEEVEAALRRILEIDARDSLACLERAKLEDAGG